MDRGLPEWIPKRKKKRPKYICQPRYACSQELIQLHMQNPPSPLFSFQAEQEKNATIKNNQINKEIEEKPVEELKEVKRDPKSKKKKKKWKHHVD